MAVKIMIKRKFKDGNLHAASRLLVNNRTGAMKQPGYISSETLRSLDDPDMIVVVSTWHSIEHWEAWKNSETRTTNVNEFRDYIIEQEEFEHYSLGLPFE